MQLTIGPKLVSVKRSEEENTQGTTALASQAANRLHEKVLQRNTPNLLTVHA